MNNHFSTSDINLVAFLISKGFFVEFTRPNGRFIEFMFDKRIEREGEAWQFSPDGEMLMVQRFLAEKEKLLGFLKNKQSTGGKNGGFRG